MNENVDNVSTHMDDAGATGPSEQEMLDAVMANSPLLAGDEEVPLPEEHDPVEDSVESDEEVEDPESDEAEIEEEVEEVDGEEEGDEGEMPVMNPLPKNLKSILWMILKSLM